LDIRKTLKARVVEVDHTQKKQADGTGQFAPPTEVIICTRIPAEDLGAFNKAIIGQIEVVAEFS